MDLLLQHPKVMALREVGLDFSGNVSKKERAVQQDVLKEVLDMAIAMKKPVVFHSRDAGMEFHSISRPLLPLDHLIHLDCCFQVLKHHVQRDRSVHLPTKGSGSPLCHVGVEDG